MHLHKIISFFLIGEKLKTQATYIYPVKMFNNVDLPAPDGPIIAVSSHDLNSPETPLSTVFWAVGGINENQINRKKLFNAINCD